MGIPEAKVHDLPYFDQERQPRHQKLVALANAGRPIPWIRVYQIPSYVEFSHKAHLMPAPRVKPATTGGRRDRIAREVTFP
jgi:hypothetical protein